MSNDGFGLRRRSCIAVLFVFAGLLLVAMPASAQVITVSSAVPDMADQGTLGLVVAVSGGGFDKSSKVAFFVTGTTNPGGIAVKSVKYKNPKTLEATIDVAPDAQTSLKFDIQVTSGSRTGKGTELFKVLENVTGGDLTPPGTITDLQAVETSWGSAVFTWTAPADDGYFDGGPATSYDLRVRRADCDPGSYSMGVWIDETMTGIKADPCHAAYGRPAAGPVGTKETLTTFYLAPNTRYVAAVRAVDDSPQGPNWSLLPPPGYQTYFTTTGYPPAGWSAPWSPTILDACPPTSSTCSILAPPRLDVGPAGELAVLYLKEHVPMLATSSSGTWSAEAPPITVDEDSWAYDFAFDPVSGAATVASVVPATKAPLTYYRRTGTAWATETVTTGVIREPILRYAQPSPGISVPTIAFRSVSKTGVSQLKVASRPSRSWVLETVADGATGAADKPAGLAFDAEGIPAVTFPQVLGSSERLVFARRTGGTWTLEAPDAAPPGAPFTRVAETQLAFDSARARFLAAARYLDAASSESVVRLCERVDGIWHCEEVARGPMFIGLSLAVGADGTVYLASRDSAVRNVIRVRSPEGAWSAECLDWNAKGNYVSAIRLSPDGSPVVAYSSLHGSTQAGGSDGNFAVSFARRTPR